MRPECVLTAIWRRILSLHFLEQGFEREPSQFRLRHLNGGQWGSHKLRHANIVKPDHREVLRYLDAELEGFSHHANCGHVVRTHESCRAFPEFAELLERNFAALQPVVSFDDKARLDR